MMTSLTRPIMAAPFFIRGVQTKEKCVALTFDDGPNPVYTPKVLSILEQYHIPATFFLIGEHAAAHPTLCKDIQNAGHEIGNHSYKHIDYRYLSNKATLQDIAESQSIFYKILGKFPLLFRPPYGNLKPQDSNLLSHYFLYAIKWNIDTKDWSPQASQTITTDIKEGSIIIFHDNNDTLLKELPETIETFLNQGYQFITISELVPKGKSIPAHLVPLTKKPPQH